MRLITAGESHGPGLVAVIDGVPAARFVDALVKKLQAGFGLLGD